MSASAGSAGGRRVGAGRCLPRRARGAGSGPSGKGLRVLVGVVAGVEANLVTAVVDLPQQGAQALVVEVEAVVELGIGVLRDEIESDGATGSLDPWASE